jgi:aryl-alcohol dehydrogenase-like predicted oxidoreductase
MAVERGVTLLDTGDFYGMGHNEMLIGEALNSLDRNRLTLSVKFGALRDPDLAWAGYDGRPAAVKNFAAYSLRRLGTDQISRIHHPGRNRRRGGPDGAPASGHRRQAQPHEAVAHPDQQLGRRGR